MEEEADDYYEHPKYQHLMIDKVVCEGEKIGSFGEGEEDVGIKYIIETLNQEL